MITENSKMNSISEMINSLTKGDKKSLARCISMVENESRGYEELLLNLDLSRKVPVIGITGPPGAGKSTLISSMLNAFIQQNKKIGIIAVDPTSPFNFGSLLGDRLRMSEHFTHPDVFIRSIATRGSLGGLSAKIIEIIDVMKASDFDYIIIETVGVGQSEIEIAGIADTTILVLVPEAGDEIQTIKSGIMEIADIFVVNKSDRDGADIFVKNLQHLVHSHKANEWTPPIIKTIATSREGIDELLKNIDLHQQSAHNPKRAYLLTEKAYRLIQNNQMKDLNKQDLEKKINQEMTKPGFNIYSFIKSYGN